MSGQHVKRIKCFTKESVFLKLGIRNETKVPQKNEIKVPQKNRYL